jgi:hypothetical protein
MLQKALSKWMVHRLARLNIQRDDDDYWYHEVKPVLFHAAQPATQWVTTAFT